MKVSQGLTRAGGFVSVFLMVFGIFVSWSSVKWGSIFVGLAAVMGEPLILTPTRISLNTVNSGDFLSVCISTVNTSKRPIRIVGARVSCTCISVDEDAFGLSPGDRKKLTIHIDTTGKSGVFDGLIDFYSDCSEKGILRLPIHVSIVASAGPNSLQTKRHSH